MTTKTESITTFTCDRCGFTSSSKEACWYADQREGCVINATDGTGGPVLEGYKNELCAKCTEGFRSWFGVYSAAGVL